MKQRPRIYYTDSHDRAEIDPLRSLDQRLFTVNWEP